MTVYDITDGQVEYQMVDPGGRIGKFVTAGEPYERKLLASIGQNVDPASGIAVDVGAHVGNHSLYLGALGFRVEAYEPDPATFTQLEHNLTLNSSLNVVAYRVALGLSDGSARWSETTKMRTVPDPDGPLPVIAYDDIAARGRIAVVKIDVEGNEPDVIAGMIGMLTRDRPAVYAEAHTHEALIEQEIEFTPLGYHLDHLIHMGSRMACWKPA